MRTDKLNLNFSMESLVVKLQDSNQSVFCVIFLMLLSCIETQSSFWIPNITCCYMLFTCTVTLNPRLSSMSGKMIHFITSTTKLSWFHDNYYDVIHIFTMHRVPTDWSVGQSVPRSVLSLGNREWLESDYRRSLLKLFGNKMLHSWLLQHWKVNRQIFQ